MLSRTLLARRALPLSRLYSTQVGPGTSKVPAQGGNAATADPRNPSTSVNQVPANDPNPKAPVQNVSQTNELATSSEGSMDSALQESVQEAEEKRVMQAPNRWGVWSRSQQPRERAMVGPRFEQTIMEDQPRPPAAIELIHRQPVRWTNKRIMSCDGGGGPLGHPRIFINVDKPQICHCTYCGLPFANEHHREHIEANPYLQTYPLDPTGHPAQVPESQKVNDDPFAQR